MSLTVSSKLFMLLCNHLQENWKVSCRPSLVEGTITFTVDKPVGALRGLSYKIQVKQDCYLVLAYYPFLVNLQNGEEVARMTEFINRVNAYLKRGSLLLDYDDGTISYKYFVKCGMELPSTTMMEDSIAFPLAAYEAFGESIGRICYTQVPPKQELQEVLQKAWNNSPFQDKDSALFFWSLLDMMILYEGESGKDGKASPPPSPASSTPKAGSGQPPHGGAGDPEGKDPTEEEISERFQKLQGLLDGNAEAEGKGKGKGKGEPLGT